ncbi:hypothetical protein J690_2838 [Acinetobacter sp. 742879]|nr:hypothetical protein J569_1578 [Acinetobacter sp. 907131]EXE58784.1 hypothetical protein J580_3158 [Acinetobacter sp. 1542444]EXS27121.1 hypothetical protein J690_2838 [Acinetobacter sp. 742879]EXS32762.1 hypothetical protein J663_3109 [Acinetobacter sp. 826659]
MFPPEYQSTILSAIQMTADIKKYLGDGKNDLNIERGYPYISSNLQ